MTRKKRTKVYEEDVASISRWRHLPNLLSISRIALVPVILWLTLTQEYEWALITYCLAALTDLLDGRLARRFRWRTRFGSFLDPIADRIFVLCLIPVLWYLDAIGSVYTALVVVRYAIQLSVLPVLMGWLKKTFNIAPDWISRLAALVVYLVLGMGFADLLAIGMFDEASGAENVFDHTLRALTLIGCILEIWVLYRFVPRYWQIIRARHDTLE